jgi:hypothetical protein
MSINRILQNGVKKLMDTLDAGSVSIRLTYVQTVPGNYDLLTDTQVDTLTTHLNVPAVAGRTREEEVSWTPVNVDTRKLVIAYLDLQIVPTLQDYVIIDGVRFVVKKLRPVPGNSVHVIFVEGQG